MAPDIPHRLELGNKWRGTTFLRETGMAPTRFGRNAVRDPRIVFDMRNGREPTERMCRRLSHYIASHAGSAAQGGRA